ncbi:unnamed protein product [Paramecium pentaurelia]|uniref:GTP-binding protein n=1 Tax=Paramecium pentaurelia TaxID=43138 RepID=A0A8S1T0H7_9CILI|nr:unnamed protein product [Paramecium pentaurelia]
MNNDICMFGLTKSGKTSMIRVIFQKLEIFRTFQLDPTNRMESVTVNLGSHIHFKIYEFSGHYDLNDSQPPEIAAMETCSLMIYVIDSQAEPFNEAVQYLRQAIQTVKQRSPHCECHCFIHKVDPDIEDNKKNELLQQIQKDISDELSKNSMSQIKVDFHVTSIFDHSYLEHFSKVIQRILPYSQSIQTLLDSFNLSCKIEKSFLFEIYSKLYLASDSQHFHSTNFQLCSEMIDVFIDVTCIYGKLDDAGQSQIKLSDGSILIYQTVNEGISLISILKSENLERPFLLEYNINQFRQGLAQIFKIK